MNLMHFKPKFPFKCSQRFLTRNCWGCSVILAILIKNKVKLLLLLLARRVIRDFSFFVRQSDLFPSKIAFLGRVIIRRSLFLL